MKLGLPSSPQFLGDNPVFAQYIRTALDRISNAFAISRDSVGGRVAVTGTLVIPTLLVVLDAVTVTLAAPPVAGAAYVTAEAITFDSKGQALIQIRVWTSGFALSVAPVLVNWIAVGEKNIG